MNRKFFNLIYCIAIVAVSAFVFAFAFIKADSVSGEETQNSFRDDKSTEITTLKSAKRGFPLINLQDGKKLETRFAGDGAAGMKPLTMENADLNADGAGDLVVGYANGSGEGYIAFYQGNPDTLSARTPEIFENMKEGRFPAPFLSEARLIKLPAAPDFVGTGDFNRDGWKDIVAAQRGDNKAFLLFGNDTGDFNIAYVELPGRVTAMMADKIDPLDNVADIAFAVNGENGASLLIYDNSTNAFGSNPKVFPLPFEATSLAIGQLDNSDPLDILAIGGGAAIIHGVYPGDSQSGQVEVLFQNFGIVGARIGNFVWDRENRSEIALLGSDGAVRILERGQIDKRPFSEEEIKARRFSYREEMAKQEAIRQSDVQTRRVNFKRETWTETDRVYLPATPSLNENASTTFFTSARMTPLGVEDLLVADPVSRKIHILLWNTDEMKNADESYALSFSGERAVVSLDAEVTPAAILPMRLNAINRPGIVLLDKNSSDISYAIAAPAAVFNVNTTADTYDGSCTAAANGCSFRDALDDANAGNSNDMIMLPAGTYTISTLLGGPDQDTIIDPAAQQSGDWDVFFDTSIIGAGQATTILQAAAAQPGHDRVLDAIQTSIGIPDLTISGVTIQNGRCRADFPCVDGGGLRYAVDNQAVLTINDSTINNNRTEVNTANPANNGGGIFGGQSDFSFTNVTVTNNFTAFVSSGCTGATQCGGEGGGVFAGIRFTANPTSVTMTNCVITGNTVNAVNGLGGRGGAYAGSPDSVSITGGTFNGNTAFTDAGALRLFTPTTISGATISNNSARQNGGGIWSDPLANDNTPLTNTFTNLVMRGNTADSDGVIGANNVNRGDGGAIFHGRGTLNLNNPTIGGTGAGEGNTAFDGGGIARTYSQFVSAVFNASTLNINNGGSIVGNLAINNGGGVINDATRTANNANSLLSIGTTTAVTITNNNARNHGGGIAVITNGGSPAPTATATLNNITLRNNTANSDNSGGGDGGAFYQNNNAATVGTTFTGTLNIGGSGFANSAANGGGIANAAGLLVLPSNASITFNSATASGGGIFNGGTINSFSGATISNNSATTSGGGIFNNGTITVSGATINSNSAATGSSLTQAGGTFNSAGTNTLGNNLAITGGTFNAGSSTVNLGGNFSFTGGTFTQGTSTFNFNGSSAQTISGTVTFNNLTVNNGNGVSLLSNETIGGTLTLTNGVLGVGSNTLTLNSTVSFTSGSIGSNSNGTVNYNQGSSGQNVAPGSYGNLTFSNFNKTLPAVNINIAGTFTSGTAVGHTVTGNTITFNGSALQTIPAFTFNNLTLNNGSGANLSGNVTVGGTMNLQAGNLGVGLNTLTLNGAATSSGGTFSSAANGTVNYNQSSSGQVVLPGNYGNLTFSNFNKDLTNATIGIAGTFTPGTAVGHTITGSTFIYNGTAAQTLPSGFTTYNNLTLNNTAGVTGFAGLIVQNLLRVQAGTFTSSSSYNNVQIDAGATLAGTNATTINISGNWTNNGTFTANGNTVNFNGSAAQTIGGSSATNFNNLTINNAAGVNLSMNTNVGAALTLTAGTLAVGSNTLTLNGAATATGGNLTSATNGTVNYNQGSAGQTVLTANYGNLTFSNSNKTLPAVNINIAGTFTPGTAVGHTVTGNTITFNGSALQTIPAFTFNNLTLNNGSGANLSGSVTVGGTLNLQAGNLGVGLNTLILNGAATASGGTFSSAANGTVNYNQGSDGQAVLAGNYGNLTFSNFNKVLPAAIVGIAGTFTPGSAVGHTVTGNTINFNGTSAQTIPVFNYNNLTLNNAAGATLSGNVSVPGTLTLTNGILSTGANVLIVGGAGTAARTNGYITSATGGGLRKIYNAVSSFTFPIGTANGYSPASVNVTAGTFPLDFTLLAVQGPQPNLTPAISLQRYWTVTPSGGGNPSADLTFNYLQSDVMGTETNYSVARVSGGVPVIYPNSAPFVMVDTVNDIFSILGVTAFSDWSLTAAAPTAASVSVGGKISDKAGNGITNAVVSLTDGNGSVITARVNSFGYYRFDDVEVGQTYVLDVRHRRYQFSPQAVFISEERDDLNFIASP